MSEFLFSNSTTKSWGFCERHFLNNSLKDGVGYDSNFVQEDLLFGTIIHEVLPVLWKGEGDVAEVISSSRSQLQAMLFEDVNWHQELTPEARGAKSLEWGRLLEGQLYGIQRVVLPFLKESYDLFSAEGDSVKWLPEWENFGIKPGLIAKPDTVLTAKEDGNGYPGIGYLEWKTVSSPNDAWGRQWVKNPQSWTGAITTRAALGLDIEWFMVCGLVKGVERDGRRCSPFCWGYRFEGETTKVEEKWEAEDGTLWRADYTAAKGWVRTSTDSYPGGLAAWVRDLPEVTINEQFVLTPPDDIDWDLAEEWLGNQKALVNAAQLYRSVEGDASTLEFVVKTYFPRRLEKCHSGSYGGRACMFLKMCHDPDVKAEPLTFYKKRIPHHQLEMDSLEGV